MKGLQRNTVLSFEAFEKGRRIIESCQPVTTHTGHIPDHLTRALASFNKTDQPVRRDVEGEQGDGKIDEGVGGPVF
jgi:hypothetical protein